MQFDQLHRRKLITLLGGAPMPMTPAELGKLIADDVAKWATVIRAANIKLYSRGSPDPIFHNVPFREMSAHGTKRAYLNAGSDFSADHFELPPGPLPHSSQPKTLSTTVRTIRAPARSVASSTRFHIVRSSGSRLGR